MLLASKIPDVMKITLVSVTKRTSEIGIRKAMGLSAANDSVQLDRSKIVVDLRTLRSDEARRDNFLRQNSLESNRFPRAEFVIRQVSGLSSPLPESGEAAFQLHGDMTLHGVTAPVTWDVIASFEPDGVTGQATTTFQFSDFDMSKPSLFFIISVEEVYD